MAELIKQVMTKDGPKQIDYTALANLPTIPKVDTVVTKNSTNAVQSGAVYSELDNINSALVDKVDKSDVKMKILTMIKQLSHPTENRPMTVDDTFADVIAAVPEYTTVYLQAASFADNQNPTWGLKSYTGIIEITKREPAQLRIIHHRRSGIIRVALTDVNGVPESIEGTSPPVAKWVKILTEEDLNDIASLDTIQAILDKFDEDGKAKDAAMFGGNPPSYYATTRQLQNAQDIIEANITSMLGTQVTYTLEGTTLTITTK